jgi:hypothetical protein
VVCVKCVIVKPRKIRRPRPARGCRAIGKKNTLLTLLTSLYRLISIHPKDGVSNCLRIERFILHDVATQKAVNCVPSPGIPDNSYHCNKFSVEFYGTDKHVNINAITKVCHWPLSSAPRSQFTYSNTTSLRHTFVPPVHRLFGFFSRATTFLIRTVH